MSTTPSSYRYCLTRMNGCPDLTYSPNHELGEWVYECAAIVPDNCLVVGVNVAGYYFDVYLMVLKPIPSMGPEHRFLVRRVVSPISFSDRTLFPWSIQAEDFLNIIINKAKELGETEADEHRRNNPKAIYKPRNKRLS